MEVILSEGVLIASIYMDFRTDSRIVTFAKVAEVYSTGVVMVEALIEKVFLAKA